MTLTALPSLPSQPLGRKNRPIRSKGEGTIVEMAPNRYRIRWFDPIASRQKGRRIYPSRIVRGTKRDAVRALAEATRLVSRGISINPKRITLWTFLDLWLQAREAAEAVRPRTSLDYRALLVNHVSKNPLGTKLLSQLTKGDFSNWIFELRNPENGRPLSPRTIRIAFTLVRKALRGAVIDDLLVKNPSEGVELPQSHRKEMSALNPQQVQQFLKAAQQDSNRALWLLLVVTGLRPSEALALRWTDLTNQTLAVQRSLSWVGKTPIIGNPKTAGSRRNIPLDSTVWAALQEHKRIQSDSEFPAPTNPELADLIFRTKMGTPFDPKNLRRSFRAILKRATLPRIRLYDLRHTTATMLLVLGENPKIVAERLGHSSIRQTLDTYSHVTPTMQASATAKISDLLFPVPARPTRFGHYHVGFRLSSSRRLLR